MSAKFYLYYVHFMLVRPAAVVGGTALSWHGYLALTPQGDLDPAFRSERS